MNKLYIGIDPGKDGFITIFEPHKEKYTFFAMPEEKVETGTVLKSGKSQLKTVFSGSELIKLAKKIKENYDGYEIFSALEDVHGRGGWGATQNFNFGKIFGKQESFLEEISPNITYVTPQKWQSFMRQGYKDIKKPSSTGKTMVNDPKAIAEMIVNNEFPNIDFRKTNRAKNNHDGKIDSFLICLYLYRTLNK